MATLRKQGDSILLGKLKNVDITDFLIESRLSVIHTYIENIINHNCCIDDYNLKLYGFDEINISTCNGSADSTIVRTYHLEYDDIAKELLIYEVTENDCWIEN